MTANTQWKKPLAMCAWIYHGLSFAIRAICPLFCLSMFMVSSSNILAQDAPPAAKETIAGLEKALEATNEESSVARQRLALRRVIRDAEEFATAHPENNTRFPALEFLFRARQRLVSLDKDAKHRTNLLDICRELVKAPDAFAELRLEADLILSQAELAKQGAGNAVRAQALRSFFERYRNTSVETKALRVALVMALELGEIRVVSYLQETMDKRFANDLEMIRFQRDKLGGQVIGAPFVGTFECSDGKTVRFPMEALGRTTMLLFWTKNAKGEALLKGIAAAALKHKQDLAGRLEIVSINLDDLPDAGELFVRSLGVDWKVLRLPGGKNNPVYDAYARSEQRIVTMSPTGVTSLTMPETPSGTAPANATPANAVFDFTRMFHSALSREWTFPSCISQLSSLVIGEFLVIDPEAGMDSARPPELKAAAKGGEVQPIKRDSTCVPEELLRSIQSCFVAPPMRYQLPLVESAAQSVSEGFPMHQRLPLAESRDTMSRRSIGAASPWPIMHPHRISGSCATG
jgi:hypothetical protein